MDPADGSGGHQPFEEMAVAHVVGGLDEADGRIFRSHLLECSDCRARVGELRSIAHELADAERDERRVRAAKAIDTKRRQAVAPDNGDRPGRFSRAARIVFLVAITLVLVLAAWNFTLRGSVARLQAQVDHRAEAAAALEFGTPASLASVPSDVNAVVKVHEDRIVVLVDGLQDDRVYGLYILGEDEAVLFRAPAQASEERLFSLLRNPDGAVQVLLTAPEGPPTTSPTGTTVVEAVLP